MANTLTPPDFDQCQAVFVPAHSPFGFGPPPGERRCKIKPVWLAREVVPGDDGLCGEMTLCAGCADKLLEQAELASRVKLRAINQGAVHE